VITELPMIVVDVQRAGPSTGMPTKTEQADLLAAMYGRHGESPIPIIAASTSADCFDVALEAARVAVRYRTPVLILSDTFLQNSSEPWRLPDLDGIEPIDPMFAHANGERFQPYARDAVGARPWAIPGTPGLEHRIGGLEREDVTGAISYDAENHERMTDLRREKIQGIASAIGPIEVDDPTGDAELLVLGWGSTAGSIRAAVGRARDGGSKIARAHLRWLNPMPANLGDILSRYPKVLIPEINQGQLALLVRARFLVDARSFSRVQGRPIWADELDEAIEGALHG
jgi:2-oxoglutarate ferredoxin oxidoreductase subunit alpha